MKTFEEIRKHVITALFIVMAVSLYQPIKQTINTISKYNEYEATNNALSKWQDEAGTTLEKIRRIEISQQIIKDKDLK